VTIEGIFVAAAAPGDGMGDSDLVGMMEGCMMEEEGEGDMPNDSDLVGMMEGCMTKEEGEGDMLNDNFVSILFNNVSAMPFTSSGAFGESSTLYSAASNGFNFCFCSCLVIFLINAEYTNRLIGVVIIEY
jgi:hypothetical protein